MTANATSPSLAFLRTRSGDIHFPAYIPVTTFGGKYPLDDLVRPYLPRLAPAAMVSHHYAKAMTPSNRPRRPLLVDSGGFAGLLPGAVIRERGGLGEIEVKPEGEAETAAEADLLTPSAILEFQEDKADVAFTLDLPIPPGLGASEATWRQRLTIANARWAAGNMRRRDLPLYACVQAWDGASARACALAYRDLGFAGIAIGGLVPRVGSPDLITEIVSAVRTAVPDKPLHVFGLGHPDMVARLFGLGVQSVDSSAYVRLAADGRLWADRKFHLPDASPMERLHLALLNLAAASGRTLPLSASGLVFGTAAIGANGRAA